MKIQPANPHIESGKTDLLKTTLIGGATGYALKYLYPVMPQEKDGTFKVFKNVANQKAKRAIMTAIALMKEPENKTVATDTFTKMIKEKRLNRQEIEKLGKPLSDEVFKLVEYLKTVSLNARKNVMKDFDRYVKKLRSTPTFVAIGASIAFASGLVYNALNEK